MQVEDLRIWSRENGRNQVEWFLEVGFLGNKLRVFGQESGGGVLILSRNRVGTRELNHVWEQKNEERGIFPSL